MDINSEWSDGVCGSTDGIAYCCTNAVADVFTNTCSYCKPDARPHSRSYACMHARLVPLGRVCLCGVSCGQVQYHIQRGLLRVVR